jgi:hypothetical protein
VLTVEARDRCHPLSALDAPFLFFETARRALDLAGFADESGPNFKGRFGRPVRRLTRRLLRSARAADERVYCEFLQRAASLGFAQRAALIPGGHRAGPCHSRRAGAAVAIRGRATSASTPFAVVGVGRDQFGEIAKSIPAGSPRPSAIASVAPT